MNADNIQIDYQGRLLHFLSLEGLNRRHLMEILDTAESLLGVAERRVKKLPTLHGKTVVNLFFEASTRTRTTFELAAKRLSADVLTLNIATSSAIKGESLLDTLRNIEAMQCDMFIVRHGQSGAAEFIARHVKPHIAVLNAGDGCHSHPTQAMLDVFTIHRHKPDFNNLQVAIVGDILYSRVARSLIQALNILGVTDIRVVAPRTLLPVAVNKLGVKVFHNPHDGLQNVDVIVMLRLQKERMEGALLPSKQEFFQCYGLTEERLALAKPDAIVMHPGPTNRGVEIDSRVADGPQSVILEQVTNGIAVRMAIMSITLGNHARPAVVDNL